MPQCNALAVCFFCLTLAAGTANTLFAKVEFGIPGHQNPTLPKTRAHITALSITHA